MSRMTTPPPSVTPQLQAHHPPKTEKRMENKEINISHSSESLLSPDWTSITSSLSVVPFWVLFLPWIWLTSRQSPSLLLLHHHPTSAKLCPFVAVSLPCLWYGLWDGDERTQLYSTTLLRWCRQMTDDSWPLYVFFIYLRWYKSLQLQQFILLLSKGFATSISRFMFFELSSCTFPPSTNSKNPSRWCPDTRTERPLICSC